MTIKNIIFLRIALFVLFVPPCGALLAATGGGAAAPPPAAPDEEATAPEEEEAASDEDDGTEAAADGEAEDEAAPAGDDEAEAFWNELLAGEEAQAAGSALDGSCTKTLPADDEDEGTGVTSVSGGCPAALSVRKVSAKASAKPPLTVSAKIGPRKELIMKDASPPSVKETPVKSESFVESRAAFLIAKAGIKKTARLTIVQPSWGQIDDLVLVYNPNTREALLVNPLDKKKNVTPEALAAMKELMRAPVKGTSVDIDPALVKLLYAIARSFDSMLFVTSGYRPPGNGTSQASYHVKGMAADIKHPLASALDIRDFAVASGAGGVGLYPATGAIHIDVREKPYYWIELPPADGKSKETPDMLGFLAEKHGKK